MGRARQFASALALFLAAGAALAAGRDLADVCGLARAAAFFFFNALICLAFFPGLRDRAAFDLRFAWAILASSSPRKCRAGKKWAILPQSHG